MVGWLQKFPHPGWMVGEPEGPWVGFMLIFFCLTAGDFFFKLQEFRCCSYFLMNWSCFYGCECLNKLKYSFHIEYC